MNTKTLKSALADDSDEDAVVVEGYDHHYRKAGVYPRVAAERTKDGRLVQYAGDEHMEEGSTKVFVTLIQ
jgi:molybdopterin-guanine dinucleotide biosynthesis protein